MESFQANSFVYISESLCVLRCGQDCAGETLAAVNPATLLLCLVTLVQSLNFFNFISVVFIYTKFQYQDVFSKYFCILLTYFTQLQKTCMRDKGV